MTSHGIKAEVTSHPGSTHPEANEYGYGAAQILVVDVLVIVALILMFELRRTHLTAQV